MFCNWKVNTSQTRRGVFVTVASLDMQEVTQSTRVYFSSMWILHSLAVLSASEEKQRFGSVPVYLSLFSENISLSRPKMSLKSWALKDTFVSQQTHEQGDQLFYFWRHCPSSQKPICTAPPIEERGQVSYFLGGLFVLPWESKVCDSTHENRRNPPLNMPTQKANRDAKCPDHFQVVSESPTVSAQTLVLQQCQGAVDAIKNWFPCPLMSLPLWNLTLLTHAVHCSVSASESILSLSSDSARHLHLHIAYACSVGQQRMLLKFLLTLLGMHLHLSMDVSAWLD